MKNKNRYRLRWRETRKSGDYWAPSAWSTNSTKTAQDECDAILDHNEVQIFDYKENKALVPCRV